MLSLYPKAAVLPSERVKPVSKQGKRYTRKLGLSGGRPEQATAGELSEQAAGSQPSKTYVQLEKLQKKIQLNQAEIRKKVRQLPTADDLTQRVRQEAGPGENKKQNFFVKAKHEDEFQFENNRLMDKDVRCNTEINMFNQLQNNIFGSAKSLKTNTSRWIAKTSQISHSKASTALRPYGTMNSNPRSRRTLKGVALAKSEQGKQSLKSHTLNANFQNEGVIKGFSNVFGNDYLKVRMECAQSHCMPRDQRSSCEEANHSFMNQTNFQIPALESRSRNPEAPAA